VPQFTISHWQSNHYQSPHALPCFGSCLSTAQIQAGIWIRLGSSVPAGEKSECQPLSQWETLLGEAGASGGADNCDGSAGGRGAGSNGGAEVLLAFADPGSAPAHPGWPLRNALLAAAAWLRLRRLRVVCARLGGGGRTDADASLLLDVNLPEVPAGTQALGTVEWWRHAS